jgi:hypothetical protein
MLTLGKMALAILVFGTILRVLTGNVNEPPKHAAAAAPAVAAEADDWTLVSLMKNIILTNELAPRAEVSGWNQSLEVHISSLLPGDARAFAQEVCKASNQKFRLKDAWTLRVFILVNEQTPAAVCRL